ncbi:Putative ribonuclease H protein At1g65750 [Linum perenne]
MFSVGEVPNETELASLFGCNLEQLPSTYLGLPLGARGLSEKLWDPVLTLVNKRLDSWKARFLSFGGRVVLIKSVLAALPVYYMSMLRAPAAVIRRIEGIQRRFLWACVAEQDKIHWINWDTVKSPKRVGGLGVQDLRILNSALLCKWLWRYAVERDAWWRSLIDIKCGKGHSEWQPVWNFSSAGCSMWKWIIQSSPIFWEFGTIDPGVGCVLFGMIFGSEG